MLRNKNLILVSSIIVLITIASCSRELSTLTPTNNPVITSTPEFTPTPVPTATPTIIPTPTRPSIPAPAVTDVSVPIAVENVSQLTRLSSLGAGELLSLQLSPDGKLVVIGTSNGLQVLDSITMEQVLFLPTAVRPDYIAFIDNGKKLTARNYYAGYVWTIPDGKQILYVHFKWTNPNQTYCYWSGCDPLLDANWEYAFSKSTTEPVSALYRTGDGEVQFTLDYQINNYYLSPDDKTILVTTPEKAVVLQFPDGKVLKEFSEQEIDGAFYFPDGKTLALFGKKLEFYNTENFELINSLDISATSMSISPDRSILVVSTTGYTQLLSVVDLKSIGSVPPGQITFSPDSSGLVTTSRKNQVEYYEINPEKSKVNFKYTFLGNGIEVTHYYTEVHFTFSSDNSMLFLTRRSKTNDYSQDVLAYDLRSGSEILKYPLKLDDIRTCQLIDSVWLPSINSLGIIVAVGNNDDHAYFVVMDQKTGAIKKYFGKEETWGISGLNFSSKSDLLVSAHGHTFLSWDIKNNNFWQLPAYERVYSLYVKPPLRISFSRDDKDIVIYDPEKDMIFSYNSSDYSRNSNEQKINTFYPGNGLTGYCADQRVISIEDDKTQKVVNSFSSKCTDLEYNNSAKLLATQSDEGVDVWDLSDPTQEKLLLRTPKIGEYWSYGYYGLIHLSLMANMWQ